MQDLAGREQAEWKFAKNEQKCGPSDRTEIRKASWLLRSPRNASGLGAETGLLTCARGPMDRSSSEGDLHQPPSQSQATRPIFSGKRAFRERQESPDWCP